MSADLLPLFWMAPALLLLGLVFLWPWVHYCWLSLHASSLLTGLAAILSCPRALLKTKQTRKVETKKQKAGLPNKT